jgi:hypothetical protein
LTDTHLSGVWAARIMSDYPGNNTVFTSLSEIDDETNNNVYMVRVEHIPGTTNESAIYVSKIVNNGTVEWTNAIFGITDDTLVSMKVDFDTSTVYVIGSYEGPFQDGPQGIEMYYIDPTYQQVATLTFTQQTVTYPAYGISFDPILRFSVGMQLNGTMSYYYDITTSNEPYYVTNSLDPNVQDRIPGATPDVPIAPLYQVYSSDPYDYYSIDIDGQNNIWVSGILTQDGLHVYNGTEFGNILASANWYEGTPL